MAEQKLNLPQLNLGNATQSFEDTIYNVLPRPTKEVTEDMIVNLPLAEITPFENHPFKVKEDEKMLEMVESIKENGVLVPAIVRPKENGGYEMVAGHRRHMACLLAGSGTIPCFVKKLSNDEATIIMVDSNLQREEILPSEKAFAYKMKLDAMKRQGKRSDLTCTPMGHKSIGKKSVEVLGQEMGESKNQIQRYIRLTELTEPLLEMTDDKKIGFRPAVELSYLNKEEQEKLLYHMEQADCTPSLEQAKKLKQFSKDGKLNENVIQSILEETKPNQKETVKIAKDRISKFFKPDEKADKIEETIFNALDFYKKYHNKVQDFEKPKEKGAR